MSRPGARLGDRFELQRQVAQDATSVVWEAVDLALDRRVLVKLLRPELANEAEAVARFRQEARRAARPGAAITGRKVLDAGSDPRTRVPFVVFEWQPQSSASPAPPTPVRQPSINSAPPVRPPIASRARPPGQGDPGLAAPRPNRAGPRLLPLLLIVPVVAAALGVRSVLDASSGAADRFVAPPSVTLVVSPVPVAVRQTATPAVQGPRPTPSPQGQPTPRPTPTQVGQARRRIVNTDGIGVALRSSPGGDKLPGKGYDEGATVTLLEQSGDWAHIRGDDGREGWVLAVTLG